MPNTASAKKRLRQNTVRRDRNRAIKSTVRTQIKKVLTAVKDGNVEQAEQEYRKAAKGLDRAGARRVLVAHWLGAPRSATCDRPRRIPGAVHRGPLV